MNYWVLFLINRMLEMKVSEMLKQFLRKGKEFRTRFIWRDIRKRILMRKILFFIQEPAADKLLLYYLKKMTKNNGLNSDIQLCTNCWGLLWGKVIGSVCCETSVLRFVMI